MSWVLLGRNWPQALQLRYGYEKAGLTVWNEPIPWNAESTLIEAHVRLPLGKTPRKSDFQLRFPGRPAVTADALQTIQEDGVFRITFRQPALIHRATIALYWQRSLLDQVAIPFLPADAFFKELQLRNPSFFVCVGRYNVACSTFVEGQCRSLLACGTLVNQTSLLPLADHNLAVEFLDGSTGMKQRVDVRLNSSQLVGNQALLSVVPPRWPRLFGSCAANWYLDDRNLASMPMKAISRSTFRSSLYVTESRYLYEERHGTPVFSYQQPGPREAHRLRPCFLVASREPGMAAMCPLDIRVHYRDPDRPPLHLSSEVLVTDGPVPCAPAAIPAEDIPHIRSFELWYGDRLLGVLPVRPTPVAAFTSEGGFKTVDDYDWTAFAEEDLGNRLKKLMALDTEPETMHVVSGM